MHAFCTEKQNCTLNRNFGGMENLTSNMELKLKSFRRLMSARASSMSSSVPPCRQIIFSDSTVLRFFSFHFFTFFDHLSLHYRNSLHRRLLDGSPRMSTLNATSPNESQVVDGPISLGASTNGDSALPSGTSSLVLRRPSANMFVSLFSRFPLLCH